MHTRKHNVETRARKAHNELTWAGCKREKVFRVELPSRTLGSNERDGSGKPELTAKISLFYPYPYRNLICDCDT